MATAGTVAVGVNVARVAVGVGVVVVTEAGVDVGVGVGVGVSMVTPARLNVPLKVGAGLPPTMSVPTRNQSGSRAAFRIHACRSGLNGVPATIGFGADSQ